MGELCDLACVYHLGQDNGTTIDHNLCTNVSSHGYGGAAYYTDAGSSNVTISNNVRGNTKAHAGIAARDDLPFFDSV